MSDSKKKSGGSSAASAPRANYNPPEWFWASRKKGPSPLGTVTWTLLRSLDLPFQWWILRSGAAAGLLRRLGAAPVHAALPAPTTFLGLTPHQSLIFGLAVGSSMKQIYWKLFVGDTVMPAGFAVVIAAYNTILNSLNTGLTVWALTSQQPAEQYSLRAYATTAPVSLYVGLALYSVGLFIEWYCEVQRKAFKQGSQNKNKPYSGGLFSLARNINYGGYTLWRSGYSLICGGWLWAGLVGTWLAGDFCTRAIPSMDAYCEKRYGEQWDDVRRKVPYMLLPWVY